MAITKITGASIAADSIDGTKIADDAINSEHITDGGIDDVHIGDVAASKLTGTVADARMSTLTASKLTGALPAIDGSSLTGITTDTTTIENNIAMLAFFRATDHSVSKYNLVDQTIDEYEDNSGIDAGASTNETLESGYYSGSTVSTGNYFGDESDGALSTSGNVTHTVQNKNGDYDGDMVVKQYSSLTINAGHTMTVDQPCRGMLIYVTGNCSISGTLTMSAKGAFANPTVSGGSDSNAVSANGLQFGFLTDSGSTSHTVSTAILNGCGTAARTAYANQTSPSSNGTVWSLVRQGAAGGAQTASTSGSGNGDGFNGNNGAAGSTGQTGGGGSGNCMREANGIAAGGAGSYGSCFAGGSGGAGSANATNHNHIGGAGTPWAGRGGDRNFASYDNSGGCGNPMGTSNGGYSGGDGVGGTIILIVGGNLTVASGGTISANGVDGVDTNFTWQGASGGASGGGNILALASGSYTNSGTVQANGGAASTATSSNYTNRTGGAGGNGSVQTSSTLSVEATSNYNNLTLQSVGTTAVSVPTTGDIVMLVEEATGSTAINTDIKAHLSRDGSAFTSAVTLTDEGSWGANKRIYAAHDVDLTGVASGTTMKYKITTHNQSASKVTRIHAASLAWA